MASCRRAAESRVCVGSARVSSDSLDLVVVLRASQALISETSVERLQRRVSELLGAMTGATAVSLATRHEAPQPAGDAGPSVPVAEAAARGWLPLSAFRYVERTRQSLPVDNATCDGAHRAGPRLPGPGARRSQPAAGAALRDRPAHGPGEPAPLCRGAGRRMAAGLAPGCADRTGDDRHRPVQAKLYNDHHGHLASDLVALYEAKNGGRNKVVSKKAAGRGAGPAGTR